MVIYDNRNDGPVNQFYLVRTMKIPFLLLLAIPLIALPIAGVNAQTVPSLTINQLLYAIVPNFAIEGNPMVTLNNGTLNATDYNAPQYYINLDTDSPSYTTGDFLNTGVSDIAATITYNGGGSGTFYYLVVFINNNGTPQYLTAIEMGDRITVNKISYNNGVFSADVITQGPNDAMCCGTLHQIQQYQLQNGSLVAMSGQTTPSTNPNVAPIDNAPANNLQAPIPATPSSSSSTDNSQWIILGGLIVLVLVVGSIVRAIRNRPKKNPNQKNTNLASVIFLIIIGIACWISEDTFFIFIGWVLMFVAWRVYVKGKPTLKAGTAQQEQKHSYSDSDNSSNENEPQAPAKKRRHADDPEMKKLYRRLMHKYHPDRGRNKGDDEFRNGLTAKINKAYQEGDFETLKLFE